MAAFLKPLRVVPLRRELCGPTDVDPAGSVDRELALARLLDGIAPGASIAIAAGSRRIAGHAEVLRAIVAAARERNLSPLVVAAMGSHGGGTSAGQRAVLAGHGITEASVGAPIDTAMETVVLGRTPGGVAVHCAAAAARAGAVVVVNRIKPHTAFGGKFGSGLLKMVAVGLGKRRGAEAVHAAGLRDGLGATIRAVGRVACGRLPLRGGIALLENAAGTVARVVGVSAEQLEAAEERLMAEAAALGPGLGFDQVDVLIVDRMGKDISGTGMDPWVIGRLMSHGEPEPAAPRIGRIYVRALTPDTRGNAHGVGLADFVHRRLADAIDWDVTRTNALAAGAPQKARLPLVLGSDREALAAALAASGAGLTARVARVGDTAHLGASLVTEALLDDALRGGWEAVGAPAPVRFDEQGDLVDGE